MTNDTDGTKLLAIDLGASDAHLALVLDGPHAGALAVTRDGAFDVLGQVAPHLLDAVLERDDLEHDTRRQLEHLRGRLEAR